MIKKLLKLIKRHIILFIFCVFAVIAMAILLVAFLEMTVNNSGKYGDRLDGISEVEISKSNLNKVSDKLEEFDEVNSASLRIQGRIIYVDITFNKDVSLDKAKEISSSVISEFSSEELEYYDFGFVITQVKENDEDSIWNCAGTKNANSDTISWVKS